MGLVGLPDGHHKHARIREAWARFAYVIPLLLAIVVFHYVTIVFLVLYAGVSLYMSFRGRSMKWLWRRLRFWLRRGVILARTQRYWRYVRTGHY